jgi:dienelactone hydrolase
MLPGGFPAFSTTQPASAADWEREKPGLRRRLWHILGDLPALPPLRPTLIGRETRSGFVVEHFSMPNGAGDTIYGYLLIPNPPAPRRPAILYNHCHTSHDRTGKEEILLPSSTLDGKQSPGEALARAGYVVMCIDAYGFGERRYDGPGGRSENGNQTEESLFKMFLWQGRTLWGMIVRDDQLALEYLLSRPEVDPGRVGVLGFSMGATRTWWLAALDERVRAAVSVSCLTRYQDLLEAGGLKYQSIFYFVPNLLKERIDMEAVVGLVAPRAHLTLTGDRDEGSPVQGVRIINRFQEALYRGYGQPDRFRGIIYPDTKHSFTPQMWQEALEWFRRYL